MRAYTGGRIAGLMYVQEGTSLKLGLAKINEVHQAAIAERLRSLANNLFFSHFLVKTICTSPV